VQIVQQILDEHEQGPELRLLQIGLHRETGSKLMPKTKEELERALAIKYADGYLQGFLDCMEEMNRAIRLLDEPQETAKEYIQ
jgi:23S rRNA A2030 N6-methylase RlmJ